MIRINPPQYLPEITLHLRGSKSISNRHLVLSHLLNVHPVLKNLSDAEDTELLQTALLNIKSAVPGTIDVRHAGTDMRFLSALLCVTPGEWQITGSQRMKERPLGELIAALRNLGGEITCLEREGYPPLKIKGKKLTGKTLKINSGISSQFVSALLLIAPKLEGGLTLELEGEVVSRPYIELTLDILKQYGVIVEYGHSKITVQQLFESKMSMEIGIESDWSSASYWFSIMALARSGSLSLNSFSENSLQADAILPKIYADLGVKTDFKENTCILTPVEKRVTEFIYHFADCPDIALTVAVTCFALGISCTFTGLRTLIIKESNRIEALCNELRKVGAQVKYDDSSVSISGSLIKSNEKRITIDTYDDHRMAMSFAPLSILLPGLIINNHGVVRKSYPAFWDDLKSLGFSVTSQPK